MPLRRPRSLNGLILVGFGLVALPLLVAVIWALVNLDRLAWIGLHYIMRFDGNGRIINVA